jgi:purine-binding chemotaxis protein CheW
VSGSALDAPGAPACLVEIVGRTFAVEIGQARETREFAEITAVPLGPPSLIGMANLRGAIVPVLDVALLLSLPAAPRARTIRTLIVEARGVRLAMAVERVLGVESLVEEPGAHVEDPRGFERGCLLRGDDAVPILDVAKIVELLERWKP